MDWRQLIQESPPSGVVLRPVGALDLSTDPTPSHGARGAACGGRHAHPWLVDESNSWLKLKCQKWKMCHVAAMAFTRRGHHCNGHYPSNQDLPTAGAFHCWVLRSALQLWILKTTAAVSYVDAGLDYSNCQSWIHSVVLCDVTCQCKTTENANCAFHWREMK